MLRSLLSDRFVNRTLLLLTTVVPGLILNFALIICATAYLPVEIFGVFYLGLTVATVVSSPASVVAFFLARRLGEIRAAKGDEQLVDHIRRSLPKYVAIVAALGVVFFLGFWVISLATNIGTFVLVVAVSVLAVSTYLVEIVRGILKAFEQFFKLGMFGLGWMFGRFVLGFGAIATFGTAWMGLLAAGFSGVLASLAYCIRFYRKPKAVDAAYAPPEQVSLSTLVTFSLSYAAVFSMAYVDIVAAYLTLDNQSFGVYSTSAVIPKGIYTLTMPIMQVMFPLLVGDVRSADLRTTFFKGVSLTVLLCAAGSAVIWATAQPLCGIVYDEANCSASVMSMLTYSVAGAALLRGIVLLQLARRSNLAALSMFVPVLGFVGFQAVYEFDAERLSEVYFVFVTAVLAIYASFCLRLARQGGASRE